MELERIISKALAKKKEDRYQHVDEIMVDLRSIKEERPQPKKVKRPTKRRNPLVLVSTALLVVILISIGILLIRKRSSQPKLIRTRPLTTALGIEEFPTWSPDGSRIAYNSDESGNWDIWIKQIATGQKVNVTQDHLGFDGRPAWSPDGEWIAFISERHEGGIFIMPSLGGSPTLITRLDPEAYEFGFVFLSTLSWSPDSKTLVYTIGQNTYSVNVRGESPKQIFTSQQGMLLDTPTWSPDGHRIAFTGITGTGVTVSRIGSVQSEGSNPQIAINWQNYNHSPTWTPDSRGLLFISDRSGSQDIWGIRLNSKGLPRGPAQAVTTGTDYQSIVLSKDGAKLAMVRTRRQSKIWSVPLGPDRTLTVDDGVLLTSENQMIEHLDVSPDGQWIIFDSNRSGNMDIWMMRKDGSHIRQVTNDPAHDFAPKWSPDGKKIVFYSMRTGNRDIYIKPVAGGAVVQLTTDPADDRYPVWSSDGQRIAFFSNRSGNFDIWIKSVEGEKPQQITSDKERDVFCIWQPDGQGIVFTSYRTGTSELFTKTIGGEEPEQLTHNGWLNIYPLAWSQDRQNIYALGRESLGLGNTQPALWAISVKDGSSRKLVEFESSRMQPSHSLATDDKSIYFPVMERTSDIWLGELEWD
jgi:Tol biopolymer transport system component